MLPSAPRADPVLPLPTSPAAISSPVKMGVFASNSPPKAYPAVPMPQGQDTGFDQAVVQSRAAPEPRATSAPVGFDTAAVDPRQATGSPTVHTGAFGLAPGGGYPTKLATGNVSHIEFDAHPAVARPSTHDTVVRKTAFDEPKQASVPLKTDASAALAIRPVEILDKPKPTYTAEARQRRIEGTVLLDVVFAATGEVRILRVVQGLGYGLDENAMDAARRIRYVPAAQAGSPVDQRVTLHVVFQITG